jgi:hypothetical protein
MITLLDPDIIFTGGIKCFWKQAEVLFRASIDAGYFRGKTYFNHLHRDWQDGKTVSVRFTGHAQQDRILKTYRIVTKCYEGRVDYRDSICAYLLSLVVLEPES